LVVALNAELHVGARERERLETLPGPVVFFKQALDPKEVLAALEKIPGQLEHGAGGEDGAGE
jgi:hypothetical protein